MNTHLSREDRQTDKKQRCSMSLVIRKMQLKTMRYNFTNTRFILFFLKENNKGLWGCGEIGMLYIAGGNVKWFSCCGKQCVASSKS